MWVEFSNSIWFLFRVDGLFRLACEQNILGTDGIVVGWLWVGCGLWVGCCGDYSCVKWDWVCGDVYNGSWIAMIGKPGEGYGVRQWLPAQGWKGYGGILKWVVAQEKNYYFSPRFYPSF